MRSNITTVAVVGAFLLFSGTPAVAQHRGHGGSGHSAGGQHGGRQAGGGGRAAAPRNHAPSQPSGRVAVPRPPVDTHRPSIAPRHLPHLSGGLGFGIGAWGYGYSAYPYRYSYPGYYGGYSTRSYGYGRNTGHARLKILGAPRGAVVILDGAYVGIVDDFDGVFQHLELTPGVHQVEIRAPGFESIVFDVRGESGRTITYRAQMVPQP